MERLSDIFPGGSRAIRNLLQMHQQNRLWAIRIRGAQKRGSITICGLLGIMSGVQIGGTCDPFSPCSEKTSHTYRVVEEGSVLDLVEIYGKNFNAEPVSGDKRMTGCSLLYRGLAFCFACLPMEQESTEGISLTSLLREPHLRSSIE